MKKEDLDYLGIRILRSQFTDKDIMILKKHCREYENITVSEDFKYINIFQDSDVYYWMKSDSDVVVKDITVFRQMFLFRIQDKLK